MLDALPLDNRVGHLRAILVHAGALDTQSGGIEALDPWLKTLLAGLSPRTVAAAALRVLVGVTAHPAPRGTAGEHRGRA
jgi:hypothetical protein